MNQIHSTGNDTLPTGNNKVTIGSSKQNISSCYGQSDAIIDELTVLSL